MADLARAAKGRAVFVAADDAAMRAMLDAATYFAPELETVVFPGLGLPALRPRVARRCASSSDRLAALHALAAPTDRGRSCSSPRSTPRCSGR